MKIISILFKIMDLLEYQAKQFFSTVGIPVLPSQSIFLISDLKKLQIPYPVVLKSQVKAGGRSKAGGIKFVENTIDAIATAQSIFKLSIEGEFPRVILAEAKYDADEEFFLAIMFDYHLKCPVLLGSCYGGINIETLLEHIKICVIKENFSPFYARHLAIKMGLTGNLIESISEIVQKMYLLFKEKDLDAIEINPLGINVNGEVMALDGKIRVNNHALARHPNLLELIRENKANTDLLEEDKFDFIEIKKTNINANIALITNNQDTDLLCQNLINKKGKISNSFLLEKNSTIILEKQLEFIFEEIFSSSNFRLIFINILADDSVNQKIIETIKYFYQSESDNKLNKGEERIERFTGIQSRSWRSPNKVNKTTKIKNSKQIKWILRISNKNDELIKIIKDLPLIITDNLEEAIKLIDL